MLKLPRPASNVALCWQALFSCQAAAVDAAAAVAATAASGVSLWYISHPPTLYAYAYYNPIPCRHPNKGPYQNQPPHPPLNRGPFPYRGPPYARR